MDEEDDPVVDEIPFFVSNTLSENLFLYQYPIKDCLSNLDKSDVVNCCAKPYNEQVKVDFAVSTKSRNYDAFRGEMLAIEADGSARQSANRSAADRPTFQSGRMDKISFVSAKPSKNVNRYVIGVMLNREIHCTPLKTILQLRPTFSYFDKKDVRDKVDEKTRRNEASDTDEDESMKQVTVKFQSSDRWKKIQEQSYDSHLAREAEEPWCETMWYPNKSTASELEKQRLFCTKNEVIGHTLGLDSEEYIKNLIPPERKEVSIDSIVPSKVVNTSKLKTLPLIDQIKRILIDAKILSFQSLVTIVDDGNLSKEKVLQALSTVGVLVRGNWVIQSELMYTEKSYSPINGVLSEPMIRARDYILYQFTKRFSVSRQKMVEVTTIPTEEVTDILEAVARLNDTSKEWELKVEPDNSFAMKHPDLVQRQELMWRAKEDSFTELEQERPVSNIKRIRKRSIRSSDIIKPSSVLTNGPNSMRN